ncbi:hypothetical protein ACE1CD_20935 [Aerosakkonema sp. BLCC-F183]|uniref:hypothetical protein n=1 Tax=Aerosakkonema sp. BLCC-F183 TaxID=3342834 RepID=UPI0035B7326C
MTTPVCGGKYKEKIVVKYILAEAMSDSSNIQPRWQDERLDRPISVENWRDLVAYFRNARYDGERVELFFILAENEPEKAAHWFAGVWANHANSAARALAFQGWGKIAQKNQRAFLGLCETEEELQQVLRDIAKEVKGQEKASTDLTRWAAAWAIEAIGFSQDAIEHLEGGALTDPPYRIRNEIINRKLQEINRIQEKDSRGDLTAEYERNLEFWLYGPAEELFRENSNSSKYEALVRNVIYQLHVRGIELAIDKDVNRLKIDNPQKRKWLQEEALRIAAGKFRDSESTEEQRRLYENVGHFLDNYYNADIPLRKLAAQAIRNAGSWLDVSIRARVLIICEQWQEAANIGEAAVSHLEEVIEKELKLSTNESDIINQQIKAVNTINRIQFFDLAQKFKILAKVLLNPEERVRNTAAGLLKQHKSVLDRDAANLLEALLFDDEFDKTDDPKNLTVPKISERISSSNERSARISNTFKKAIAAIDSLKIVYQKSDLSVIQVKEFVRVEMEKLLSDVKDWIKKLNEQKLETEREKDKITSNQSTLKEVLSLIKDVNYKLLDKLSEHDNYEARESTDYETYNKCQKLYGELKLFKTYLLSNLGNVKYNLIDQYQKAGISSLIALGIGLGIIFVTYVVSPPLSKWYRYNSPTPDWFQGYNHISLNTFNRSPWYASGFPKNSCGSSSSNGNCWHPVFIQYSESNWNRVMSNHCRDVPQARNKTTAKEKGEIQVASFSTVEDAQGFANYIKEQYGSGRVGERKCY